MVRAEFYFLCIVLVCVASGGCASNAVYSHRDDDVKHSWGEKSTLFPKWERFKSGVVEAATNRQTWMPLLGAAIFGVTGLDKRTSDWAREQTPVFGSQEDAELASDNLRKATRNGALISAVLTPNGASASGAITGKLEGMGLQYVAYRMTRKITGELKKKTHRLRPNEEDYKSFPSGHSSDAFVAGTLARRNVAASHYNDTISETLDVGFVTLEAGTAWARVEAGKHYPSDVLVGSSLGYFIAAVFNDVFIGEGLTAIPRLSLYFSHDELSLKFLWHL